MANLNFDSILNLRFENLEISKVSKHYYFESF